MLVLGSAGPGQHEQHESLNDKKKSSQIKAQIHKGLSTNIKFYNQIDSDYRASSSTLSAIGGGQSGLATSNFPGHAYTQKCWPLSTGQHGGDRSSLGEVRLAEGQTGGKRRSQNLPKWTFLQSTSICEGI